MKPNRKKEEIRNLIEACIIVPKRVLKLAGYTSEWEREKINEMMKKNEVKTIMVDGVQCLSIDTYGKRRYERDSDMRLAKGGIAKVMMQNESRYIEAEEEKKVENILKSTNEKPKTMLQDFQEKYPQALQHAENGMPWICPCELGYADIEEIEHCNTDCVACWNRPLLDCIKE